MVRFFNFDYQDRLTNRNLCGIDTEFCYPYLYAYEVAMYYKLPPGEWEMNNTIGVYTPNFETLIFSFAGGGEALINQYFAYLIAKDSNGDNFIIIRQIQPLYNYDGVTPELTCYAFGIDVINEDNDTISIVTEPVCSAGQYTMNHFAIQAAPADIPNITFHIKCGDEDAVIYDYDELLQGWWLEWTGPFVDLFLPEGCILIAAIFAGNPLVFGHTTMVFGAKNCNNYVRITGNGSLNYDCKGRYFGTIDEDDISDDNLPNQIMADDHISIDMYPMTMLCSRVRELANKITPQRLSGSCYIPRTESLTKYRIDSNSFHVPAWYLDEINIISATQKVTVSDIADDYGVYIPLVQADEYGWREVQGNSQFFIPALVFETCVCFTDFKC